jgi:predicted transcriptional regulator
MEDKIEYLKRKLLNDDFNVSSISKNSGISAPTIYKIINGGNVRDYIINILHDYFKKIGD